MQLILFISFLFLIPYSANCASWSPPQILSSPMVTASNPQVECDPNGNFTAAWIENGVVTSNTLPINGSWGNSLTAPSMEATSLQLAVDGQGNATAVWIENGMVTSSSLPFGGTWSQVTILSGAGATGPQVAADSAGDVIAIWEENGAINSKTQLAMQAWPTLEDNLATSGDSPQIAINAQGLAAAVWHSAVNSVNEVFCSTKSVGGSWNTPQTISNSRYNSVYPKIAVDSLGNLMAAWYRYTLSGQAYSSVIVQAASLPLNGSWQIPVDVSSPGIRNPADLSLTLAFNHSNYATLLWTTSYDGSTFGIEGSRATLTGWISPIIILPSLFSNLYAYSATFSIDASNYAFDVFMASDKTSGDIVINTNQSNITASFPNYTFPPQIISNGTVNGYPQIASTFINGSSQVVALWLNYDGMYANIQSAVGTNTPYPAPTNLAVVQTSESFGIFTDFINTLSWDLPTDPQVTGFLVYRNGQPFASGLPQITTYSDHNQTQNGPVTYSIAFYVALGNQSQLATVQFP